MMTTSKKSPSKIMNVRSTTPIARDIRFPNTTENNALRSNPFGYPYQYRCHGEKNVRTKRGTEKIRSPNTRKNFHVRKICAVDSTKSHRKNSTSVLEVLERIAGCVSMIVLLFYQFFRNPTTNTKSSSHP